MFQLKREENEGGTCQPINTKIKIPKMDDKEMSTF